MEIMDVKNALIQKIVKYVKKEILEFQKNQDIIVNLVLMDAQIVMNKVIVLNVKKGILMIDLLLLGLLIA